MAITKAPRADIEENGASDLETYDALPANLRRKLDWFQDQKLGIIFHWGLYSQAGIVESWQLSKEDTWARKQPWRDSLATLRRDYWALAEQFNPHQFDADAVAKRCREAGFKYALFTTKHHDGFNMYDTQASDYSVTHYTGQDLFAQFAAGFHRQGLSVGAYYSKADWHSPLYWEPGSDPIGRYASYDPKQEPAKWQAFNHFVATQLNEICTRYGQIDILWLDGGWVNRKHNEYLAMPEIVAQLRTKQPDLLVVDRTIGGAFENYVTPERKVPSVPPRKAWESNIPLAKNWGYVPHDTYKSFDEILTTVLQVVALGGNVILGLGLKPTGQIPAEAQALLDQLGPWLAAYGTGIYKTRPAAALSLPGWFFTQRGAQLFAFARPDVDPAALQTSNFAAHVRKVAPLGPTPDAAPYIGYACTLDQPYAQWQGELGNEEK